MKKFLPVLFLVLLSSAVFAQDNLWDYLRLEVQLAESLDLPVKVVVFLLSLAIFSVSVLAYSKSKSKRILLVSIAFLLFTLKWAVKIIDIYYSPGNFISDSVENIFELGIFLSLLVALLYRKSWSRFFEKENAN